MLTLLLLVLVSFVLDAVCALIAIVILVVCLIGVEHVSLYLLSSTLPYLASLVGPALVLGLARTVTASWDPVTSLISLIAVFFLVVIYYVLICAEFLAFVFLIVYVGAVAILFLFVIMLLNVKELTAASESRLTALQLILLLASVPAIVASAGRLTFLLDNLGGNKALEITAESIRHFVNTQYLDILLFGVQLYTKLSYLFVLISLLLLVALLGSIVLATGAQDEK